VIRKQLLLEHLALMRNLILRKCRHQIGIFQCPLIANFRRKTSFVSNELKFWKLIKSILNSLIPRISTFFESRKLQRRGLGNGSRFCIFFSILLHEANVFYLYTSTCRLWIFRSRFSTSSIIFEFIFLWSWFWTRWFFLGLPTSAFFMKSLCFFFMCSRRFFKF